MPPKTEVAVFEDNKDWQKRIREILENDGHSVVLTATNIKEALEATKRLKDLGVKVATIDGNLNSFEASGDDGRAIIAAIKANAPDVKTIGMSALGMYGVDVNVGKANAMDLGKTVTKL
jgi:CheY-like chemotaxis protein